MKIGVAFRSLNKKGVIVKQREKRLLNELSGTIMFLKYTKGKLSGSKAKKRIQECRFELAFQDLLYLQHFLCHYRR